MSLDFFGTAKRKATWFAVILFLSAQAFSGERLTSWLHRDWQTDDGLPNNDVTAVAQATDGAMLFATRAGLARFDGLRLEDLPIGRTAAHPWGVNGMCVGQDGAIWLIGGSRLVVLRRGEPPRMLALPAAPADPHVNAMLEHPRGTLWICFDDRSPLSVDLAASVATGTLTAQSPAGLGANAMLACDAAGELWGTRTGTLAHWTEGRFETVASLPQEPVILAKAHTGGLWLAVGGRLLRHTLAGGLVETDRWPAGPPNSRVSALLEDREGRVWIGTFGDGLYVREHGVISRVELPNRDIWSLYEDREGNLWAGTGGGGVCLIRPRVLTLLNEPDAPAAQTARSLWADARDNLWVALQNGGLWRRQNGSWRQLTDRRDWPAAHATCVAGLPDGRCWIGTSDGDLVRWDGKAFEQVPLPPPAEQRQGRIRTLLVAPDGEVWIGRGNTILHGVSGSWLALSTPAGSGDVRVLARDLQGQIWAGTRNGVLLEANATNLVTRTPPEMKDCGPIHALLAVHGGALWIGTSGGLARLLNGRCRVLTTAQGLRHNVVSQLVLGPHDRIWAAGDRGIFSASFAELTAVADGNADTFQCIEFSEGAPGLQANSGYTPNLLLAPDGSLWFATRSGIAIIDPSSCGANTVPPSVAIAALSVNGQAVALPAVGPIRIGPGAAEVRFTLSAMSYVSPQNVRLRHRLAGADPTWRDTPADRTITYSHLPPGDYTLSVRAANNDGVWSPSDATLHFTVQPAFYQRTGLRLAAAAAGIAAVFLSAYFATLRRRAVAALRESEVRYRSVLEEMVGGFALHEIVYDDKGQPVDYITLDVNRAYERLLQVSRNDVIGKRVYAMWPDLDREWLELFAEVARTGEARSYTKFAANIGKWFEGVAFRPREGRFAVTFVDVTERRRVAEDHARLATAVEQAAEPILITDAAGAILYANPAFGKVTGYAPADVVGQNPRLLKSGNHNAEFYRQMWATLTAGRVWSGRIVNRRKDGTRCEMEATISPVVDATGRIVNYVAVDRDVTYEVALEEQNRQAAKMEAIGLLAGGVAHDFNNHLQIIMGNVEMILDGLTPDHPIVSDLNEIQKAARHSADLTRQLLTFSRKQLIQPVVLDLNAAITNSAQLFSRLLGENIRLEFALDPAPCPVSVDPNQLDQLLTNLAIHVRDASNGRSVISIATAQRTFKASPDQKACAPLPPGDYVVLTFRNNGVSMTPEVLSHIFEPFFTTKGLGKGTGLGLATVYGIVRQNSGVITAASEPAQGTTFTIHLPRVHAAVTEPAGAVSGKFPVGTETLLVTEDETSVLKLARRFLEAQGYRVLSASEPAEALRLCAQHPETIHLLLTDVIMPEMNGPELAGRVRELRPGIRVLYMSGYTADIVEKQGHLAAGLPVLQKPFTHAELARSVRTALDAQG